ncbi:MAG: aminoacyl-tRNA hydrolase [Candidatus Omnitrophota bacterium]
MLEKYLIVGLGNPGKEYEYTRHNLGFLVLRQLAKEQNLKFSASPSVKGLVADLRADGKMLYLLMPLTYMNNSGLSVGSFIRKKEIPHSNILVIADDFNLEFGQLRLRKKGSDGGHNGLKSIINHLKTEEFGRLRLGIGRSRRSQDAVDFVLEEFNRRERKELEFFIQEASDCGWAWFNEGINYAMNHSNRRKGNE